MLHLPLRATKPLFKANFDNISDIIKRDKEQWEYSLYYSKNAENFLVPNKHKDMMKGDSVKVIAKVINEKLIGYNK